MPVKPGNIADAHAMLQVTLSLALTPQEGCTVAVKHSSVADNDTVLQVASSLALIPQQVCTVAVKLGNMLSWHAAWA